MFATPPTSTPPSSPGLRPARLLPCEGRQVCRENRNSLQLHAGSARLRWQNQATLVETVPKPYPRNRQRTPCLAPGSNGSPRVSVRSTAASPFVPQDESSRVGSGRNSTALFPPRRRTVHLRTGGIRCAGCAKIPIWHRVASETPASSQIIRHVVELARSQGVRATLFAVSRQLP